MFDIYYADCRGQETNCLYPHKASLMDPESFKEAVSHDYVCAKYKNNYRTNTNFECSDCEAIEFDNDHSDNPEDWVYPEDLREALPGVAIAIHFSRNHMKPKNGKTPRPKFHAFILIETTSDEKAYSELKKRLATLFPFVDPKALDSAHFFYGTKDPQVEFYPGTKTLNDFLNEEEFDVDMRQGTYGVRYTIPEGRRNATMSRFAGRIVKRFGWNDKTHEIFMAEAEKCDPPLPEHELDSIWRSARKFEKVVSSQPDYIPPDQYNPAIPAGPAGFMIPEDYSDIGEAKVLQREYGRELAFNAATDFLHYDGAVWNENKEDAYGATVEFLDIQLADAELLVFAAKQAFLNAGGGEEALSGGKKATADLSDELLELFFAYMRAKAYQSFVMQRRNAKYITATMTVVKPMVSVELDDLNHDPLLLNTPQASYRLADGLDGRQEHSWDDYCTKCTTVEPGETGKELWLDALNKTFLCDQELINYVQEVVGLAVIGKVYMEAMIIAYGEGRNGKSTFWNTISRVLGSYSGDVSADTLTVGCRRNVKPEMAELKGVRLALAKELEEGMRLNTSIVKQLTSTDQIFGEKKYCKPAHFTPSHTLVLYTNHLPRVGAMDEGTWRRLVVIPFNAVFEGKSDVKNYADFLFENAGSYILTWIIEGAQRIIKKGFHLKNPKVVQDAIDEYRSESDWFAEFFTECCEAGEGYTAKSGDLYSEYRAFCLRMGEFARSTAEFYKVLASKGYFKKRSNKGVLIYGLRLKSEFPES